MKVVSSKRENVDILFYLIPLSRSGKELEGTEGRILARPGEPKKISPFIR